MSIKNEVLNFLRENKKVFRKKYGIKEIWLFGSVARGEDTPSSDIDLINDFKFNTFDNYYGFLEDMKEKFKRKIDLATKEIIKERLKPYIYKDLIST